MNICIKGRGFTLIEILVVISIIGILSAVLYANFGDARTEAKNESMQAELKEVQLALELYKAQNNRYPDVPACGGPGGFGVNIASSVTCDPNPYIDRVVPEFIAELPSHLDSANSNCDISYKVKSDGSWYKLTAINCHGGATAASEGVQSGDEFARCLEISTPECASMCTPAFVASAAFYESYAVYSAGGECK